MKKVLVAIDVARSDGNEACIRIGRDLARAMDGAVVLLHVVEPIPRYAVPAMPAGMLEQRNAETRDMVEKLAAEQGIPEVVIREGMPAAQILGYASEIDAAVIVLNSHDPEVSDYLFGSVASRVVRHAHCSVYVVRTPPS